MTDLEALFGLKLPAKAPVIPIDRMIVLWDEAPGTHIVTKLRVMNTLDQTDRTDHEYPNSAGCCASRWPTEWQHTPLGLFVQLLADGFPSRVDMQAALYQFRNVEGLKGWTSVLLVRTEDPNIARILDQEDLADEQRDDSCGERQPGWTDKQTREGEAR